MKKNKNKIALMITAFAAILLSCSKPNNKPPVADTELESSVDAVWATFVITDVEQMCAFGGENHLYDNFYVEVPGSKNASNSSGTMTPNNNPLTQRINFAFNTTKCYDGRLRSGNVFMKYGYDAIFDKYVSKPNPNAKYHHDNGFVGRISFAAYEVDGWEININAGKHGINEALVVNMMPEGYLASAGPIKWRIVGDFNFKHPSDPSKNMEISVDLVKAFLNANNGLIYNQTATGSNILWSNFIPASITSTRIPLVASNAALIAHTGTVSGTTSNGAKFRMVIDENHPLIRDFKCYADKIGGTASIQGIGGLVPIYNELHPFSQGIASFTTGCNNSPDINIGGISNLYPRQIYFGNEDNPGLDMQCDNSGSVLIKGIGYQVDFRK